MGDDCSIEGSSRCRKRPRPEDDAGDERKSKDDSQQDETKTTTERQQANGRCAATTSVRATSPTVYIGNLHPRVAQVHLEKLMKRFGTIERLELCFDRMGRPRGYAFCEYQTKESAQTAMDTLHNRRLSGRNLVVRPANDQSPRDTGGLLLNQQQPKQRTNKRNRASLDDTIAALKGKLQQK